MRRGTLVVSHYTNWFPFIKSHLEALGYDYVHTTDKEKDGLNMLINDIKPRFLFIDSDFYSIATPYMVGEIMKSFPRMYIVAITTTMFSDERAVWFVYYGAKSYINALDGPDELRRGLKAVLYGEEYIADGVQKILDGVEEFPDCSRPKTRRLNEMLLMLCNAFTLEQMMDLMHLCKRSVEYHVKQLRRLFHCKTREEVVKIAHLLNIVTNKDLYFTYGKNGKEKKEKGKSFDLPEWAEFQQKINKGRGIGSGE